MGKAPLPPITTTGGHHLRVLLNLAQAREAEDPRRNEHFFLVVIVEDKEGWRRGRWEIHKWLP
jgi:hypothetical protein